MKPSFVRKKPLCGHQWRATYLMSCFAVLLIPMLCSCSVSTESKLLTTLEKEKKGIEEELEWKKSKIPNVSDMATQVEEVKQIKKALDKSPSMQLDWACMLQQDGNTEGAATLYRKIAEEFPNTVYARSAMNELRKLNEY